MSFSKPIRRKKLLSVWSSEWNTVFFYLKNSLCKDEGCPYDGLVGCGESHLHVWLQKQNIKNKNKKFLQFYLYLVFKKRAEKLLSCMLAVLAVLFVFMQKLAQCP